MDTRIVALIFLISVAGSLADLQLPLFRLRRDGLQETARPLVTEFAEVSRMKRESGNLNASKGTTVPASTLGPITATSANTSPENVSAEKADPTSESTPDSSQPTTSSAPDPSSTTSDTLKPSPTSTPVPDPTTKSKRATPKEKLTTSKPTDATVKPEETNETTEPTSPSTQPTSPKSDATTSNPSTEPTTPGQDKTPSSPSDKSTTPKSTKSGPSSTPAPNAPSETTSESTTGPKSTTVSPALGSRFNLDDDDSVQGSKKPPSENQGPSAGNPTNPMNSLNSMYPANPMYPVNPMYPMNTGFPSFPFSPFFMPNYVPDFAYPSNPHGDSTFNTGMVPGSNNAWAVPSNGGGFATSFASAGASAGASDNSNYNTSPLVNRGGFPEQQNPGMVSNTANEPIMPNVPNTVNAGGYGYGGDVPYYGPNSFAFPGYSLDSFQRQMEEHFKQLQAQFQRQQQAIFEASNRIGGADPGSSAAGPHTAISSISLGPGGGYQAGAIHPAAPNLESRFGEEIPPPSGNSYGVFSSSSSHSVLGPDGKTVSHKSSTTGVNDNGKITFRTVQD